MKTIRVKLAFTVSVSFVLTFSVVLAVFNYIMIHQIERNSGDSIRYLIDEPEDEVPPLTLYMSNVLFLDADYTLISKFEVSARQERTESAIAQWCSEHQGFNQLRHLSVLGRDYYLSMVETAGDEGFYEIVVWYVDVSGEMSMMRSINLAVLLVMFLMGIGASILGYFTGVQIEHSQAAQKTFFENTSHELKTPLTSIRGYAEGMLTEVITDHRLAAQVILGETEKMASLVDDILTSARLESGAVKLHLEHVNLRELIEDCLLPLEGAVRKRGLSVDLNIRPGQIIADPNQLEHALNNLLTNAIKYAESQILVEYDGERLTIWNDGSRLSMEDLKHVFDRFYIGKTGSTGIGLALAKDIAELHGWKLRVTTSNEGVGFVFLMRNK